MNNLRFSSISEVKFLGILKFNLPYKPVSGQVRSFIADTKAEKGLNPVKTAKYLSLERDESQNKDLSPPV